MKNIILFLGIISILYLCSCKKDVTACIDLDGYTYNTGTPVTFTSCSKNELSYDWRMTGPENAPENSKGWSDRIIINTFSIPGAYSITLNTTQYQSLILTNTILNSILLTNTH